MSRTILAIAPGALGADTFSRGSAANYIDANGVLQSAATNVVRDGHYEQGVRTILLEGAGTNAAGFSDALDDASWTKTGLTVTANFATAPDQTVTSEALTEDTSTGSHFLSRTVSGITAGAVQSASVFVKAGSRTRGQFYIINTDKVGISFDLTAGTVTPFVGGAGALANSRIVAVGNGWYRISWSGTLNATATTATLVLLLANAAGSTSYTGDGASRLFAWRAQFEANAAFSSSAIQTPTASSASRSPDIIGWTIPDAPHAMEWVIEFFERGAVNVGSVGVAYLGADAFDSARFQITTAGGGKYQCAHNNGAGSVAATMGAVPAIGDRVKLRAELYDDGSVELFQSINGGAEATSGRSAANPFAAAWSAQTFRLNSIGNTHQGNAAYISATLTDLHLRAPSIVFTDAQGTVTIPVVMLGFEQWAPDVADYPPGVSALGNAVQHQFPIRTDYIASFQVSRIPAARLGDLMRLKRWMMNGGGTGTGGAITVNTEDAALRTYTCTLAPGTVPSWRFADAAALEYTLSLTVRNSAGAPMLCDYTL